MFILAFFIYVFIIIKTSKGLTHNKDKRHVLLKLSDPQPYVVKHTLVWHYTAAFYIIS